MTIERRNLLKAYGAQLVLTPGAEGMPGAIAQGQGDPRLAIPAKYFMPQQFENPANPEIHRRTTAEEIWRDTDGNVDVFVAASARAARSPASARCSRSASPAFVSSRSSPTLARAFGRQARPAQDPRDRRGFRADDPEHAVYDEVIRVTDDDAIAMARRRARGRDARRHLGRRQRLGRAAGRRAAARSPARPSSRSGATRASATLRNPVFAEQEARVVDRRWCRPATRARIDAAQVSIASERHLVAATGGLVESVHAVAACAAVAADGDVLLALGRHRRPLFCARRRSRSSRRRS